MRPVFIILSSVISLFFISCNKSNQFPQKVSERTPANTILLNEPLAGAEAISSDSLSGLEISDEMLQLQKQISEYENKEADFSLEKMEALWQSAKSRIDLSNGRELAGWIETTGFLLEVTGKPVYAESLQQISEKSDSTSDTSINHSVSVLLKPFIFTKNVDHIFVNLFADAAIEYEHSMGGKVRIEIEKTNSRSLLLKFNTTEKLYVELNILIPSNAENPSVIEKNVKYVANPGEYCLIARKWKEGDIVEVNF